METSNVERQSRSPHANSTNAIRMLVVRLLTAACVALTGCAGPALLREARPVESSTPVAQAWDERVHVSIETVILRNGPGAWARDAAWDEYLIRIRALSDEPVEIREIAIFDALDYRVQARSDRSDLEDGTREIERRYWMSGTLVTDLEGRPRLPPAPGAPSCANPGFIFGAAGLIVAGACIERQVRNVQVNSEIRRRQTTLPVNLPRGAEASVDLFFPLTPQSGRTQVVYADRQGEHRLDVDTRQALMELGPPTLVSIRDPGFPDEARESGINRGYVRAQLTLDKQGRVQAVEVIESWPRHIFDEEARRTFHHWTYSAGRYDGRTVEARVQFKR